MNLGTLIKNKEKQAKLQKEIFSGAPERFVYKAKIGLSRQLVQEISWQKNEPDWMRKKRLMAYDFFLSKPMPTWGVDLSGINFDKINFYQRTEKAKYKSWEDVPADIKNTFEKIPKHITTAEEIKSIFEQLIDGKYETERRLDDEHGIYLWEVTVPEEDGHTEYGYMRKGRYAEGEASATAVHVVFYNKEGIPVGGHDVAEYVNGEWKPTPLSP